MSKHETRDPSPSEALAKVGILPTRTLTLASFCGSASTCSLFQCSTSVTRCGITVRQNVIAMPKLVCGRTRTLNKLYLSSGKDDHLEEEPSVAKAADVGIPVDTFLIVDGEVNNLSIEL